MRPRSVATPVLAGLVAIATILLGLAGLLGYQAYDGQKRAELRERTALLSHEAAIGLALPMWSFDRDQMSRWPAA